MPLQIAFELSDRDLDHFRDLISQARDTAVKVDAEHIVNGAHDLLRAVNESEGTVPAFIRDRLQPLRLLIDMVSDNGWDLAADETERATSALAYFANPQDLIPDHVPGLGFLDDAIMVELVCMELREELDAYKEFKRFKQAKEPFADPAGNAVDRDAFLQAQRQELQSRMRHRRRERLHQGGRRANRLFDF